MKAPVLAVLAVVTGSAAALAPGCGGSQTSVPSPGATVNDLSSEQGRVLCADLTAIFNDYVNGGAMQRAMCVGLARDVSAKATSPEAAKAQCDAVMEACVGKTPERAARPTSEPCGVMPALPSECAATLDEMKACTTELVHSLTAGADDFACDPAKPAAAAPARKGACAAIRPKCNDMPLPAEPTAAAPVAPATSAAP